MFLLCTTYSVLCISADRLTIGSIKLSPPPEDSLRDRGLIPCGVHDDDSLSNFRSSASRAKAFSLSCAVRLFLKFGSYLHSLTLFICWHWLQAGLAPLHFCKSEININQDAGRERHLLVFAFYRRVCQGKERERGMCRRRRTHRQERQAEPRPNIPDDSDLRGIVVENDEEFEKFEL